MGLRDAMKKDAAVFTNTADFGEPVVLTPRGGAPKTINALVIRHPLEVIPDVNGSPPTAYIEVYIHNDATLGATKINTGGDTITLPWRIGDVPQARLINEVPGDSDDGLWHLILR